MIKPKINSVDITVDGNDKIEILVRFQDVDAELKPNGGGFTFSNSKLKPGWHSKRYKLVKNDDHIFLKMVDTGGQKIVCSKQYDYDLRYPVYQKPLSDLIEQYGSNFSIEKDGDNIKLFPIYMKEVKQVTKEMLNLLERYSNENNLIEQ